MNMTKSKLRKIIREELLNEKSWEDDEKMAKKVSDKIDKGIKIIVVEIKIYVKRKLYMYIKL